MIDARNTKEEIKRMAKEYIKATLKEQLERLKEYSNNSLELALQLSIEVVGLLKEMNQVQAENQKEFNTMCNNTILFLQEQLKKDDLGENERIAIYNNMREILTMVNQSNEKARKAANNIKIGLAIAGTTLTTLGIAYFGYQYYYNFKLNNPRII